MANGYEVFVTRWWVHRVVSNPLAWSQEELSLNPIDPVRLTSPSFARRWNKTYNIMGAPRGCQAVNFDSCNNWWSSVHTILVIILRSASLNIKRKYIIINTTATGRGNCCSYLHLLIIVFFLILFLILFLTFISTSRLFITSRCRSCRVRKQETLIQCTSLRYHHKKSPGWFDAHTICPCLMSTLFT